MNTHHTITMTEWPTGICTLSRPGTAPTGWGEDYQGMTWYTLPEPELVALADAEGVACTDEGIDADTPAAERFRAAVMARATAYGHAREVL